MSLFCPLDDPSPLSRTYQASAPPPLARPALKGQIATDVAIIGAGDTGLSTALHLAERGIACVVLEARDVGSGGSGRAFGQVVPYSKHSESHLLAHFGEAVGHRIMDATAAGPDYVYDLVRRYGIECDASQKGLLFAANSAAGERALAKRAAFWSARGAPVNLLIGRDAHATVGSTHYSYVLADQRGGQINPLAFVRGLALAAQKRGVDIYENSRVVRLEPRGTEWRIHTATGTVDARRVLLAGGAYLDELWPDLRLSFVPMRAYQLVTEPLSDNVRRTILPEGHSLTDTRRLYSGMRLLPDGRLHLSVDGPAFNVDGNEFRAKATARLRQVFPQAGDAAWAESWTGWVDMTGDQYPHVHELAKGLWTIIGLSGRGLVYATLLGREMAARFAGDDGEAIFMPVTPVRPIGVRRVAAPLVRALMTLYRVLDRTESATYLRRTREQSTTPTS
jgi:glycine/D-amino acid oxidase-like deaminating enzyme